VFSLRFDVFRCASMFSVALPAALSAQSGRLLGPSSLRGEQRAHYLLGICQSRFIATAIEGVPLRISFAKRCGSLIVLEGGWTQLFDI
jgi:hypothetical protein